MNKEIFKPKTLTNRSSITCNFPNSEKKNYTRGENEALEKHG